LIHVSKIYRSRIDDRFKFAISAPVWRRDGSFAGVIHTAVTTDAAMGGVIIEDARRKVALIAPRDIEDPEWDSSRQPAPGKAVIVFHPGYQRGTEAVQFPDESPIIAEMAQAHANELDDSMRPIPAVEDYEDPVASVLGEYTARWIAGFAPVGNTGFVILVQQRYDEALALDPSTSTRLIAGSTLVVILTTAILLIVLWRFRW
jgi:hypothetical protein